MQYQVVMTRAVHCHCDVCSPAVWHSAGCRTSWVCLQHHNTMVTCNGVTVRGSQFPPTVSKHCQHQHSAIHKTIPAIWNTNSPSCCDIQGVAFLNPKSWQPLFIARVNSSLTSIQTCQHTAITISHNLKFYSLRPFAADPLRLLPIKSNC